MVIVTANLIASIQSCVLREYAASTRLRWAFQVSAILNLVSAVGLSIAALWSAFTAE